MTNREGDWPQHQIAGVCAEERYSLAGSTAGLIPDIDAIV